MSVTHKVTHTYNDTSNVTIQCIESIPGAGEKNYDNAALASGTNVNIGMALTQADLLAVCIFSSTACTIYTNAPSSGSPQDTIHVQAGQVILWTLENNLIAKCPFSNDVTAMYVTNAATTSLKIRTLLSATP